MKDEYDFSKGERGKFFNKDASFNIPVYLESENFSFITAIAERKHCDISSVVNQLINSDRRSDRIVEIME